MSYTLVTNAETKKIVDAIHGNGQYLVDWDLEKVDEVLGDDGVVKVENYEIPEEDLLGARIGINNWSGGTEKDVRAYSDRVVNQLKCEDVYVEVFDIQAK